MTRGWPGWLQPDPWDEGLTMTGHGMDDVDDVPACNRPAAAPMNPDCRDGKHQACAGDAWDDTTDQPTRCACPCHTGQVHRFTRPANPTSGVTDVHRRTSRP